LDPITHLLVGRLVGGRSTASHLGAVLPDLPWYAVYPAYLASRGEWRRTLDTGDWPAPPSALRHIHLALHSCLLPLGLLTLFPHRRAVRSLAVSWLLHIVVDLPTHARERMAPMPLYPMSKWSANGISWADVLTSLYRRFSRR